jgi:hypothetical protein
MSELVANCPRCKAKQITFDLTSAVLVTKQDGWLRHWEAFCVCRHCSYSSIFVLSQNNMQNDSYLATTPLHQLNVSVNQLTTVQGHISLKDEIAQQPPEHLPPNIHLTFLEGAACMAIGCYNASTTMFRLSIDLATKTMLPEENENGLNNKIRRSLGLRLKWLFDNKILTSALQELSTCIQEDGNDGAHQGILSKEDAEDISDFTYVLLERLYTEPYRLELAKQRREIRREASNN